MPRDICYLTFRSLRTMRGENRWIFVSFGPQWYPRVVYIGKRARPTTDINERTLKEGTCCGKAGNALGRNKTVTATPRYRFLSPIPVHIPPLRL